MPAPENVVQWIKKNYPKPRVANDWLNACCDWITTELDINPQTQSENFIKNVEKQLLDSDLRDSMEPGTGLVQDASRICGILVEVTAITEIGSSAFSLFNVRQTRNERADLAGLAQEEGEEDHEGPIPNYPRQMLRLELSDGTVSLPAIEYRSIPQLKLGETPLGFKILLKNVSVRRGIIFLEPNGTILKGHTNSDRDERRERDFLISLLERMRKPIPSEDERSKEEDSRPSPPPSPQRPVPHITTNNSDNIHRSRSPIREISIPPDDLVTMAHVDNAVPLSRKRKNPDSVMPSAGPSSVASTSQNTLVPSRYFSGSTITTASTSTLVSDSETNSISQNLYRILSPVRGDPIDITDSSNSTEEVDMISHSSTDANKTSSSLRIDSDGFDMDDIEIDLEAIDLAEQQALEKFAINQTGNQPRTCTQTSNSTSSIQARPLEQNVIIIEDDSDDDKENLPTQRHRKRRRISKLDDVIDISD